VLLVLLKRCADETLHKLRWFHGLLENVFEENVGLKISVIWFRGYADVDVL
jgi:hypothetical protein